MYILTRKFFFFSGNSLSLLVFGVLLLSVPTTTLANNIPIASTVTLETVSPASEGSVVIADEDQEVYMLSDQANDARFYGVTADLPPVFFSTGTNTVPIITEGVALVRVVAANGPVARGDLLVTSDTPGVAMRAGEEDQHVFAIALQAYDGVEEVGSIQAEISVAKALAEREAELAAASAETEEATDTTLFRGAVATILIIGALFFVLYSFRSAFVQGVTSVGRNPRAKASIMTLSVASIIFALLLCALVVFIAVAILVLPL